MRRNTIIAVIILGLLAAFLTLVPSRQSYLSLALGAGSALFIIVHFLVAAATRKQSIHGAGFWIALASLSFLFVLMPLAFAAALYLWQAFTVIAWVMMVSLTMTVYFNFLTVPLAIYQKHRELYAFDTAYTPTVSVLIPAYNEEKVLARTIETVLEATYPDKEVIVINDGSTDRTRQIADGFADRGVKVIHRPNGGKATALNHGLMFVIVDADSRVCKNTLVELVKPFRNPEVAAVAGNIKVFNRGNLLTKCQALEYIASINIARRALDIFGSVSVVPGALGAYRREALESSGRYDTDTLVEDFDITIKALKSGKVVQASSSAVSYTEAPETIREFVKQRLRWYRGNFQAMWKHHDAAYNHRYGFLQRLAFPYMAISMTFLPLAGLVTLAAIVMLAVGGAGLSLLIPFGFFCFLQFLLCFLAIRLDGEDWKLALYSPFLILGYKQLCDFVMIKSMIDVLLRRKVKWAGMRRIGAEVSRKVLN